MWCRGLSNLQGAGGLKRDRNIKHMKLNQHREIIKKSLGLVTDQERQRLCGTVRPHLTKAGAINLSAKKEQVKRFVDLIIETQNEKSFFWIDSNLPFCWNNPRDWRFPYIRFQWGHLEPNNSLLQCNQFQNLCLQSARCNNQIQSSMPIMELKELFYGSRTYDRIIEVEKNRERLFISAEWLNLCKFLQE